MLSDDKIDGQSEREKEALSIGQNEMKRNEDNERNMKQTYKL